MKTPPKARICSTGSEIMQGLYADENARALSTELTRLGFQVVGHAAFPDHREFFHDGLYAATNQVDLIVITGGLGPTEDDLTRDVVAKIYQRELKPDSDAEEMIRQYFSKRTVWLPEKNLVQAQVPQGASVILNSWGTAPGFYVKQTGTLPALVALPGPPSEWKPMWQKFIADGFLADFPDRSVRKEITLHFAMYPESHANEKLKDFFDRQDLNFTLLASQGHLKIRAAKLAQDEDDAEEGIEKIRRLIISRIGEHHLFGEGSLTFGLAEALVDFLKREKMKIATAESLTGGLIAHLITNVPGASSVLEKSWVTYSNSAKIEELGVPGDLFVDGDAVSEEVALAMAKAALQKSRADVSIAVTGVAGPDRGSSRSEPGTVCFAAVSRENEITLTKLFPGDRASVKNWTANQAFELVRQIILMQTPTG